MLSLPELLRVASRTFAVGIERLPRDLREAVQTSYLLLRVSDYLEDNEQMAPDTKQRLLLEWAELLETGAGSGPVAELQAVREDTPDALVARNADRVLDALARLPAPLRTPIVQHVADSTRGMARWAARGPRIDTEMEFDDYMHEVAGRVGYLLTDLFAAHAPDLRALHDRMMPLAREFGLGLQTVNVIRGLPRDLERGWIFFPEAYVRDLGVTRADVFEPRNRQAAHAVLDRLVLKAERHLDAALRYTLLIPRRHHRVRVFCMLPLFFAVRTLAISRGDARVFVTEVKIDRREVRRTTRVASLLGWSNRWVRDYARRLAR